MDDDRPSTTSQSPLESKPLPEGRRATDTPPHHPKVKLLAFALLIMLSSAFGFLGGWLAQDGQTFTPAQDQKIVLENQGQLISEIVDKVGKSVVSITVEREGGNAFFGFDEPPVGGTGIILSEDGLIVTNRHVLPDNATNVSVTLSDGTEYDNVEIVGRTANSDTLDIAFLQIGDTQGKKLTPATLGDSGEMNVGDAVVAIGNALGQFQNTVTSGIISGFGRSVQVGSTQSAEVQTLENVFQTDAAINEGNSGGPLVNLEGEVIGINTAAALENAQNIGFAIPINDVTGLIESVRETGTLQRPFLGVVYISLTNDVAEFYGLSVNRGAYIPPSQSGAESSIVSGGPAEEAGLREGDIITKVGDEVIDQNRSLAAAINKHKVGDTVTLTIVRDGNEQTFEATLGAAPTN